MVMGTQPTPMRPRTYGAFMLAGGLLSPNETSAEWLRQIGSGQTPVLEGSHRYRAVGPSIQCGAPDETGAHVCVLPLTQAGRPTQ